MCLGVGWGGEVAWRVALGLIKSLLWLPFGQEYSGIVTGLAAAPCGVGVGDVVPCGVGFGACWEACWGGCRGWRLAGRQAGISLAQAAP